MGVLNQVDHVAEGVRDAGYPNITTDIFHRIARLSAAVKQTLVGIVNIANTPVRNSVVLNVDAGDIRIEPELEPTDLEPNIA